MNVSWSVRVVGAAPDDPFGPVDHDPDRIRENACRLLSPDLVCAPPSSTPRRPPNLGWLDVVFRALVLVAIVALAVGLVYLIVRVLMSHSPRRPRRRRRRQAAIQGDDDTEREIGPVRSNDPRRHPREWRAEADEHRRAGRYRDALRCRYRALVGDLARAGVIDEIPGRTTGEERAQMGATVAAAAPFRRAADLFDDAWFGDAVVDDADVQAMEVLEHEVIAASAASRSAVSRTGTARAARQDGRIG